MSGGTFGNFWRRLTGFGDEVREAMAKRAATPDTAIDPDAAAAILRIVERLEALAPEVKAVEYLFDGDIVTADLVRLESRYGGK